MKTNLRTLLSQLLNKVYKWDHKLNETGELKTRSAEVKEICEMHGISQIYQQQGTFSVSVL